MRFKQVLLEDKHYFASSQASWVTSDNLQWTIQRMKLDRMPFVIYLVDMPQGAIYKIKNYAPDVDASKLHLIGQWTVGHEPRLA